MHSKIKCEQGLMAHQREKRRGRESGGGLQVGLHYADPYVIHVFKRARGLNLCFGGVGRQCKVYPHQVP